MDNIKTYNVFYKDLIDPGSVCTNPTFSYSLPEGITVPCVHDDYLEIQINPDVAPPYCLTFRVHCDEASCEQCDDIIKKVCFCIDGGDCTNCSTCNSDHICVSTCSSTQVCDDNTCSNCSVDLPCDCPAICDVCPTCVQGNCQCPADRPIKNANGCCVQCVDSTVLGLCEICVNGVITQRLCPGGYCNPTTGNCQSCLNDTHCTGVNECCRGAGVCDCCTGYMRDPNTGDCIIKPPCFDENDCVRLFGKCYTCDGVNCVPKICPNGGICNPSTGECEQPCINGVCPPGSGCINGICVPCSQLSCTGGQGLQCQFAIGCQCTPTGCAGIDCSPGSVSLQWVQTPGTPGTIQPGTGLPGLQGTAVIVYTGIVSLQSPNSSNYANHRFDLGTNSVVGGSWTLENQPGVPIPLGSGITKSFDLASTGPNLVGFIVRFTETGTGRTARWSIWRTPTAPLTAPDVWHADFTSAGIPPSTTGGTPGSLQLCANNGNFSAVGVTNVQTTGDIIVTFFPNGANCFNVVVSGCGTWNGDVILRCGGQLVTVHAPEFSRDPANCCDPTDPNCGGIGFGNPCTGLTVQPIDLVVLPTFGSTASGDGEFLVIADWTTAGLSFEDLFYLNPSSGCWSTSNNPDATSNDIAIVTDDSQSPFGPSVSALSTVITLGDAGCIQFGYSCTLKISGCRKLQGQECMDECDVFAVDIISLGGNTYTAVSSLNDEVVTYTWTYPGLVNPNSQTITITPVGGSSQLLVTAKYGSPVKCTATDVLNLNTFIPGCTNFSACNFSSTANVDDGSCILIAAPTYTCNVGFVAGLQTASEGASITYRVDSTGNAITTGDLLDPGEYTINVYNNNVKICTRALTVGLCYSCSGGECTPAASGANNGPYTTDDCNGACNCGVTANGFVSVSTHKITVTGTGGSGIYDGKVERFGNVGSVVTGLNTFTSFSTSLQTLALCDGVYIVTVRDHNNPTCFDTATVTVDLFSCETTTMALTDIQPYDCINHNLIFTIVSDPCVPNYRVSLINSAGTTVRTQTYPISQAGIPVNFQSTSNPADGTYTVKIEDNIGEGCSRSYDYDINCGGTLIPCAIDHVSFAAIDHLDTGEVTFSAILYTTVTGGNYTATLSRGAGGINSCSGSNAVIPLLETVDIEPTTLATPILLTATVPSTGSAQCFRLDVERNSPEGTGICEDTAWSVSVNQGVEPPCDANDVVADYNYTSGQLEIEWDFPNVPQNLDLTVQVYVSTNGSCTTAVTALYDQSGHGRTGVLQLDIEQTGVARCVTVEIFSTSDPTCTGVATEVIDSTGCSITILSAVGNAANTQVSVTYEVIGSSGIVNLVSEGGAGSSGDGTLSGEVATTGGTPVQYTKIIDIPDYPAVPLPVTITVTDDVDGACTDSLDIILPANCIDCLQGVPFVSLSNGSPYVTIDEIRDTSANIITSTDSLLPTAQTALVFEAYSGIVSAGGDFCNVSPANEIIFAYYSANSPRTLRVQQNSAQNTVLDYVDISYAAPYAGTARAFFGDCSCDGTPRVCDYQVNIAFPPIVGDSTRYVISIEMSFLKRTGINTFTTLNAILSFITQAPSPTELSNALADIIAKINAHTYTCNTVIDELGSAVTYEPGGDILTIDLLATNAGLSSIRVTGFDGTSDFESWESFTQSNCV